jgi:hypothetical protein
MTTRVQKGITAGMALVGAGVVAAMPVAQQAPEVLRSAEANVQLAAALNGTPAENLALSAQRTVTALVGAPVGLATAAAALAQGGPANNAIAAAILKEVVDGPLYAADPAIYALDDLLPAPVGGSPGNVQESRGTSLITQFRADQLIAARDDINEAIRDSLGVGTATQPTGNEVSPAYAAARIGGGLAVSAQRAVTSAVTAPLGLVAVAEGLQESLSTGDNTNLYLALQAYIDAPNYVTDPIVFAADDVTPAPVGGDPQTNPALMNGSEISRLRGNVLLAPRDAVRNLVAGNLGVDPVTGADVNNVGARSLSASDSNLVKSTAGSTKSVTGANSSGKPVSAAVKAVGNEVQAAADRFQRRVEKLKSAVEKKKTTDTATASASAD